MFRLSQLNVLWPMKLTCSCAWCFIVWTHVVIHIIPKLAVKHLLFRWSNRFNFIQFFFLQASVYLIAVRPHYDYSGVSSNQFISYQIVQDHWILITTQINGLAKNHFFYVDKLSHDQSDGLCVFYFILCHHKFFFTSIKKFVNLTGLGCFFKHIFLNVSNPIIIT